MRVLQATLESWVLGYLLNSLWQIPLVFVAALAAARVARKAGPRLEHRVWVGALLLEAGLPICHFELNELWRRAWGLALWFRHAGAGAGQTQVVLGAGTASQLALPWLAAATLEAVAAAYLCGLVYFAGRLAWGVWRTEAMRRHAAPIEPAPEMRETIAELESRFGMSGEAVRIAVTAAIPGPAAVGVRRPTLLTPPGFLAELTAADLEALLAHELAHMRRQDFAKNLLYGVAALPAAYHPVLALTRRRLAETRELICDGMAAEAAGGRESYAKSLLRLASMLSGSAAPRIFHAIGILDANTFERRVMQLTRSRHELRGMRRVAAAALCALMAFAACASALALRMEVTEAATENQGPPAKLKVKVGDLTLMSKVNPVYPVQAKKDKVSGTVVLAAIIGKDGEIENLRVTKSVRDDLDQSSLDAVRQWIYKPYLVNGNPVEVETSITVIYSLAN
jgi:TonB family protein